MVYQEVDRRHPDMEGSRTDTLSSRNSKDLLGSKTILRNTIRVDRTCHRNRRADHSRCRLPVNRLTKVSSNRLHSTASSNNNNILLPDRDTHPATIRPVQGQIHPTHTSSSNKIVRAGRNRTSGVLEGLIQSEGLLMGPNSNNKSLRWVATMVPTAPARRLYQADNCRILARAALKKRRNNGCAMHGNTLA